MVPGIDFYASLGANIALIGGLVLTIRQSEISRVSLHSEHGMSIKQADEDIQDLERRVGTLEKNVSKNMSMISSVEATVYLTLERVNKIAEKLDVL